jgi:hypothetical protein
MKKIILNPKIGEIFTHMVNKEVRDIFALTELETVKNKKVDSKIAWTNLCVRMGKNGFACKTNGKQDVCWINHMRKATKNEKEFYYKCISTKGPFI